MIGPTTRALSPVTREENVRIGPISVFALIIIICMAVMAVLTISTAHASLILSQRQAQATHELYLDETAAQTFVAEMDDHLEEARSSASSAAGAAGARNIETNLVAIRDRARNATDDEVEIVASMNGQRLYAEFSCAGGRTLNIIVTILPDGTYRIDKWKMSAVENEEQPMGTLFTGS